MRLKGKSAIITGGARGLGFGCAKRFHEEGAAVAIVDIDDRAGKEAAGRLSVSGSRTLFFQCDVGQKVQVDETIASIIEAFGQVDVLVSNAGINRPADFLVVSEQDFDQVIRTNLKSVFLFGQGIARHMVDRKIKGSIINMCSTSAIITMPTLSAYASSKGGIAALTRAMALSLAPHGIRVNAIGPGTILTDLTKARLWDNEETRRTILSRTPLGRFGEPADVAALALFLATDDAAYLTGQTIYIEGGRLGLNYTVPVAS